MWRVLEGIEICRLWLCMLWSVGVWGLGRMECVGYGCACYGVWGFGEGGLWRAGHVGVDWIYLFPHNIYFKYDKNNKHKHQYRYDSMMI